MLSALCDRVVRAWEVRDAKTEYYELVRYMGEVLEGMNSISLPVKRARYLYALASICSTAADAWAIAFGLRAGDDGRPGAESWAWRSRIYESLANVEAAVAESFPRRKAISIIENVAGYVLDDMIIARGTTRILRGELYRQLTPLAGRRTVSDAVLCLPFPGYLPLPSKRHTVSSPPWVR